jgi:hypothetical protein
VVQTSANFERSKDQKTVAKVFVTCEVMIFGLGLHMATGEEWAAVEHLHPCGSSGIQARAQLLWARPLS